MQEKPNSQSKVPSDFTRQFLHSSPGRPPAAVSTRSRRRRLAVDRADHVRIGRQRARWSARSAGRRSGSRPRSPWRAWSIQACGARQPRERRVAARSSARRASPTTGERAMLGGVEAGGVERDQAHVGIAEHGPGAGGEVLQPRADRQHHVGLGGERVGRGAPITPSGPALHRMLVHAARARPAMVSTTGMRWRRGEGGELGRRPANSARRRPATMSGCSALRSSAAAAASSLDVRPRPRHAVHVRLEERRRVVEGLALHVLRRARGRPGRSRPGRAWSRPPAAATADDLLGPDDAVPVAGHRLEGVVDRDGRIVEVLDLLQHRIGHAVGEGVARQQQHRQPVASARPPAAVTMLVAPGPIELVATMICRRRLALAKPTPASAIDCSFWPRQVGSRSLHRLERLAQAGDVAVAEDREHARRTAAPPRRRSRSAGRRASGPGPAPWSAESSSRLRLPAEPAPPRKHRARILIKGKPSARRDPRQGVASHDNGPSVSFHKLVD